VEELSRLVGRVVLVDDGSPAETARSLDALAAETGAELVRLPRNAGKGTAVAAGIRHLGGTADAVLVFDNDGQHPPAALPRFFAAAERAELVVGDRFGDLSAMPRLRRIGNRLAGVLLSVLTRRRVRDTQCGMRLLRGRALRDVPFPEGGYEAETVHLKRCLRAGLAVEWVPIPTVYAGEPSSFRSMRDTLRVLRALLTSAVAA
jgi:glycosyltransferase involved in cell wall biosynthesis